MTPEMQLAKMLSAEPTEQEKLASALDDLSIEELEQVLRDEGVGRANGSDERLSTLVQWADNHGREMAKSASMQKVALPGVGALAGMAQKAVGAGAGKVLNTGLKTRAAVGAGVGAVGGALKDPGVDAQGQKKSRLGNMAVGAGIGAGLGAGSRMAVSRVASGTGATGNYVRQGMKSAINSGTGGAATQAKALQQGKQMRQVAALERTGKMRASGSLGRMATPRAAGAPAANPAAAAAAAAPAGMFQRAGNAVQGVANKVTQVAKTPLKFQSPIARAG